MKPTYGTLIAACAILTSTLPAQTVPVTGAPSNPNDEIIEISPFVVSSSGSDSDRVTESTSGTLVSRPLEKLPMGISVVSSELMRQLNIFNADSLNLVVPGLANQNTTSSEGTGNNTQYASRGFTVLPRLDGFAPGGRLFDMTAIDRVEIIRGPNSLLYGQSDAGGIINYISKRPHIRDGMITHGFASLGAGNFDFGRAEIDVDTSLIPKTLAFRLPASYTTNEREFNFYRNRVTSVNPSVLWRVLPNTEVSFVYQYLDVKTNFAAFQPVVWTAPGAPTEFLDREKRGLGRTFNFFGPYAHAENKQHNWVADITSRLTDNLTFRAAYSDDRRDRNELTPVGGDPFRVTPLPYRGQDVLDGNHIKGYKGDLLGVWDLGPVKTRTIAGYEYNDNVFFSTTYRGWHNGAADNLYTLNVGYDPTTGRATRVPTTADFAPFHNETLDPNYWRIEGGPARYESKWINKRISEVLSAFDDRVQFLGGVARGTSKLINTTTGAVSAQDANVYQLGIGVAVDPRKQHMLFANKSTSYQPQFLFDKDYNPLPPTTAEGVEGGLKSTWGETGLQTTVTIYDQKRVNVGRQFTDFQVNPPLTYGVLTPGEETKGVELEAYYKVNANWNLTALWAQFKGKITGVQPGKEFLLGRELPRAPDKSGSLLATYRGDGALVGFRFTLGAQYRNDTWLDLGEAQNTLYTRRSDAGTVLFLVLSKEWKLQHGTSIAVRLNVGNLLNRDYIAESFTYGEPRTIRLATDFRF